MYKDKVLTKEDFILEKYILLYTFLLGIVFIEPSPSDLLFIIFLLLGFKYIKLNFRHLIIFFISVIPILVGLTIGIHKLNIINIKYWIIDMYLIGSFILNIYIIEKLLMNDTMIIDKIMRLWKIIAIINIIIAMIGLFQENMICLGLD